MCVTGGFSQIRSHMKPLVIYHLGMETHKHILFGKVISRNQAHISLFGWCAPGLKLETTVLYSNLDKNDSGKFIHDLMVTAGVIITVGHRLKSDQILHWLSVIQVCRTNIRSRKISYA